MATEMRRRIEPWPIAIALLLASMILVSLTFLRTAIDHPDPVMSEDGFASSAAYDAALRQQRSAEALGWAVDAAIVPTAIGIHVTATLRDASGTPIVADRVTARRERPAEGGLDAELELVPAADGAVHEGEVALPRLGRWWLWLRAERAGETLVKRVAVVRGGA